MAMKFFYSGVIVFAMLVFSGLCFWERGAKGRAIKSNIDFFSGLVFIEIIISAICAVWGL